MKPLNESSKKTAVKKFIGIYALSLVVILLSSFFLFSSPVKILKDEAKEYNEFKSSYGSLLKKTGIINTQINELLAVKQVINSNPSADLDSIAMHYIDEINKQVISLRNDSANALLKPYKTDMANYLSAYNAVLYYSVKDVENRNMVKIPKTLPTTTNNTNNTNATNGNVQLMAEVAKLKIDNLKLTSEYNRLKNETPPTVISSNEDVKALQLKLTQIKKESDACVAQIVKAQDDLKTKDGQIKELNDQLSRKVVNPKLTEEEKASLLFDNVDQVIQKAKNPREGAFPGLIVILRNIRPNYPDKAKLDNKIKEIQKLMQKTDF